MATVADTCSSGDSQSTVWRETTSIQFASNWRTCVATPVLWHRRFAIQLGLSRNGSNDCMRRSVMVAGPARLFASFTVAAIMTHTS